MKEEQSGMRSRSIPDSVWKKCMQDKSLSDFEKLDAVRRHADYLELKARQDEALIRGARDSTGRSIEVNDRYLDAISAKLRILENL